MNWLAFLSSAAIGSLLGLLAKEGIDWLRAERTHRLELRQRYFDAKLDATIRVIRQMKHATAALRSFTSLVKENEESGGWIHPSLLGVVTQSFGKNGEKVTTSSPGERNESHTASSAPVEPRVTATFPLSHGRAFSARSLAVSTSRSRGTPSAGE